MPLFLYILAWLWAIPQTLVFALVFLKIAGGAQATIRVFPLGVFYVLPYAYILYYHIA